MKITKTYSIDDKMYKLFEETCQKNNVNKSAFLEGCVKKFLKNNIGFDDELYYSRLNKNYVVSILERDDTFFILSDGSKIPQIQFYQTFIQVEQIDPEKFFASNRDTELNKFVEKLQESEQLNNDKNKAEL